MVQNIIAIVDFQVISSLSRNEKTGLTAVILLAFAFCIYIGLYKLANKDPYRRKTVPQTASKR